MTAQELGAIKGEVIVKLKSLGAIEIGNHTNDPAHNAIAVAQFFWLITARRVPDIEERLFNETWCLPWTVPMGRFDHEQYGRIQIAHMYQVGRQPGENLRGSYLHPERYYHDLCDHANTRKLIEGDSQARRAITHFGQLGQSEITDFLIRKVSGVSSRDLKNQGDIIAL